MRGEISALAPFSILSLALCGCSPGSGNDNDNANTNDNDNSASFEQSVIVDLSTNGEFELVGDGSVEQSFSTSIRDALGMSTLDAFAVSLEPDEVELTSTGTNGLGSNGVATLDVLVGALGDEDVCTSGLSLGRFEIALDTNGDVSVEPERLSANATALGLVSDGEFEMCLRADSQSAMTLTLTALTLLLNTTAPNLNCSEIFALAQVQDALDILADEGLSFDLRRGTTPLDIAGTYTVDQTVEFDPDGADEGELPSRTDAFSNQAEGTVTRSTGRVELDQFITGTENGVSLCVLARTNNSECDQLIARVESYDVGTNGLDLEGSFLAVVIERHDSQREDCGQAGDFIFGRITLTNQAADGTQSPDIVPPDPVDDEPPDPVDDAPPDPVDEAPDPLNDMPKRATDTPPANLARNQNPPRKWGA